MEVFWLVARARDTAAGHPEDQAIENYEKSIRQNRQNQNGSDMLKKLKGQQGYDFRL